MDADATGGGGGVGDDAVDGVGTGGQGKNWVPKTDRVGGQVRGHEAYVVGGNSREG